MSELRYVTEVRNLAKPYPPEAMSLPRVCGIVGIVW